VSKYKDTSTAFSFIKYKKNMIKWMFIIVMALNLSGCADTADAEDVTATTPAEAAGESSDSASDETWIAVVLTWNPVVRTIDKEFTSEVECWNFYEGGTGESRFGTQHLDHQDNPPTKDFNFGPDYLEYPIRTYRGKDGQGSVWLTCDLKSRYEEL
jgi:uncharacterized protein YceK